MAKGKKSSSSTKNYYTRAKNSNLSVRNREAKLERHCAKFPDDAQAAAQLGKLKYRRYASKNRNGWADLRDATLNPTLRTTLTKKGESVLIKCMGYKPFEVKLAAQYEAKLRRAENAARYDRTEKWINP